MDRQSAADYLGVSIATLDRYKRDGLLKPGLRRGNRRPSLDYHQEDLDRFRQRRQEGVPKEMPAFREANSRVSIPVGFRLDRYYSEKLTALAEQNKQSAGECARVLVIRALENQMDNEVARRLLQLREELVKAFNLVLMRPAPENDEEAAELQNELNGIFPVDEADVQANP